MLATRIRARAFTLLELIVVIVILAAISIPSFTSVIDKSREHVENAEVAWLMREASALAAHE